MSRTELWAKARDLMMKDRNKLQSKLEMYECTFRPQIVFNPGDNRSVRPNEHLLLTVAEIYHRKSEVKRKHKEI